jgi:acetyltransferase-like isoleucine patch superfamily enzyme
LKALKEIGLRKAFKFGYCTVLLIIFKHLVIPQFRSIFLRVIGVKLGKNVILHSITFINCYQNGFKGFQLGNDCFIGDDSLIDLSDQITLANQVTLADRVTILTHTNFGYNDHPLQSYFPASTQPVIINQGSFIGVNVTIMPGITIGPCAVVEAGSVVTESVAPYTVVGGVPARVLKTIPNREDTSVKTA